MDSNFGEKLAELALRRSNEFTSFIRQILIICSTIIGIMVSLKEKKITDTGELISFITVIGLLGLCTLIGLTLLYGEIRTLDRLRIALVDQENKFRSGDKTISNIVISPTEKIFLVFAKIYYVTFGLAICSIVAYSYIAFS